VLSAFCWYLTLAFQAFVALTRVVIDTQTHTHNEYKSATGHGVRGSTCGIQMWHATV